VAALLFEHLVWGEGGLVLVMFKRLRLKPASWFAMAVVSLFSSIVGNIESGFLDLITEKAKNSAEYFVWIGYIVFKRLIPGLMKVIVEEDYIRLPKFLFYPLIDFEPLPEELKLMDELNSKYSAVMRDLFSVMLPGRPGIK
jgi:hypothetical protein